MDAALDTKAQAEASYDGLPDDKKEFVYNNIANARMNEIIETSIIELKNSSSENKKALIVNFYSLGPIMASPTLI